MSGMFPHQEKLKRKPQRPWSMLVEYVHIIIEICKVIDKYAKVEKEHIPSNGAT